MTTTPPPENECGSVLWLASYPKTGSTWLREILTNILVPGGDARLSAIPSFQKAWPEDVPQYLLWGEPVHLLKTHLFPQNPRMRACPHRTLGAITIRRHPLDILLSALNYAKVKGKADVFLNQAIKPVEDIIADDEFPYYIDQFSENDGFPWFSGPAGELSLYRERWLSFTQDLPHHEICYEDLFADPENGIRDLLGFLQIEATPEDIQRVYRTADRRTAQNGAFFWKRRAYNFEDILSSALIAAFHAKCADQLAGSGYPARH